METDARHELEAEYQDFAKAGFPKLGYKVEGLPEADSVLAGFVSQALACRPRLPVSDARIIGEDLPAKVADVCQQYRGSQDAAELERYVVNMRRLESTLRRLLSLADKE